jgi:hypothetical protein
MELYHKVIQADVCRPGIDCKLFWPSFGDMNMSCLIKFHVDMLTLLKRFLTKEAMQKVRMKTIIFVTRLKSAKKKASRDGDDLSQQERHN